MVQDVQPGEHPPRRYLGGWPHAPTTSAPKVSRSDRPPASFSRRPPEDLLVSSDGDPFSSRDLGKPRFVGRIVREMVVVSLNDQARRLEGLGEDMSAQVAVDEEYPT